MEEVRVPALGESVVEATIGRILKRVGDRVEAGEDVIELETDKVNVAVPSERAGVLTALAFKEGDTVSVNDVVFTIDESAGASAMPAAAPNSEVEKAKPESAGNGQSANGSSGPSGGAVTSTSGSGQAIGNGHGSRIMTPVAREMVAQSGVDVSGIAGSGTRGKLVKSDIAPILAGGQPAPSAMGAVPTANLALVQQTPSQPATPSVAASTVAPVAAPVLSTAADREVREPMSRRRQAIARNLKDAQNTAVLLTTFNEVDMLPVMELRKRRQEAFVKRHNVKLGFMSIFTKASISALKAFPLLNAEISGTDIIRKEHYDIGIAVGVESGLVVPIIRDADRKGFAEIEREIGELAKRARDNKLTLEEMQGGTFTITNGGTFGSMLSTPILNAPQVGILGMHNIVERPVVVNGEIVIRPIMYVALSYDHRIVDGSEAVRFLVHVKTMLEDPEALLLES